MSNSTTDSSFIYSISSKINYLVTLFVFALGTVGNLLNIIVFSQPELLRNPCVRYFLGSSIAGLGIVVVGLPSRMISEFIMSDQTNTNGYFCKLRIFLLYSFRTVSTWLLVFAMIDRWFLSSTDIHRRRLSSNKNAYRNIILVCFLSLTLWIESIFCYDVYAIGAPVECYGKSATCRIFNDIVYASVTVVIPSILMLIFGLLTIRNIRRSRQSARPSVNKRSTFDHCSSRRRKRRNRRSDFSLTCMLLVQVILLTICSLPQAMHQFYLNFTVNTDKTSLRTTIEDSVVNLNVTLTYIGNAIPFYIYTLNGIVFRRTLLRLILVNIRQINSYLSLVLGQLTAYCCTPSCPNIFPTP